MPIDEDKLFITDKAEGVSQASLAVMVNIWDEHMIKVVRGNVLNNRLIEPNKIDVPIDFARTHPPYSDIGAIVSFVCRLLASGLFSGRTIPVILDVQ